MASSPLDQNHKAFLDTLLLKIPGVEAMDLSGLPAYLVAKRMFACIHAGGVGIRLPAAEAANLTFSRDDVTAFEPKGRPSSREWIQINHADSADYEKDLEVFQSSIQFVRSSKG